MRTHTVHTEAARQYAAAHAAHYSTKDLREALGLYQSVIAQHPTSPEAEYSRSQIRNLARSVVPEQELLDAHAGLVLAHISQKWSPDVKPAQVTPISQV